MKTEEVWKDIFHQMFIAEPLERIKVKNPIQLTLFDF